MRKNNSVIEYLLFKSEKDSVSISKLSKLIYLSDWKSVLKFNKQITSFNWEISYSGPFCKDIEEIIQQDMKIFMTKSQNNLWERTCNYVSHRYIPDGSLSNVEYELLDYVLDQTKYLSWNSLLEIVNSTFPIMTQERYITLDLIRLAQDYRNERRSVQYA